MPRTDGVLLSRWGDRRDADAFAELISRHAAMVHGTCLRLLRNVSDAEDITQECFLKLSRKRDLGSSQAGGWLHRVATNSCLDRLRVDARRDRRETAYAETSRPAQEPTWSDIKPFVDEAIANLSDDLRAPLVLHFLEDKTHKATAAALGLKRATTTRRIHRGIEQIREHLKSKGVEAGAMTLAALFEANTAQAVSAGLMRELKKVALTDPGVSSQGISSRPALASRGLLLTAAGLAVVALIMGGVTLMARSASGPNEPETSPSPPPSFAAPAFLAVVSTAVAPPEAPAPEQGAIAEEAPIQIAQAPDEPEDPFLLRCVDTNGDPVEGAEVYLVHRKTNTPGMRMGANAQEWSRTGYGPHLSDADGIASLPHIEEPDESIPYSITESYTAYARLPGKLVGAWRYTSRGRSEPDWNHVILVESMRVEGTVLLPAGFDPRDVSVRALRVSILNGKSRFGSGFSMSERPHPPLWPELFAATPDDGGRFALNDIPKVGTYNLAATGAGLGEKQFLSRDPEVDSDIEMELVVEGRIAGTLLYSPSGTPASDVAILARPSGRYQGRILGNTSAFVTRTDYAGRFTFTGLPEESYNVYTYPLGNPHEWVAQVLEGIVTEPGYVTPDVDLWFERGVHVEGRVSEEVSGEPVPEVLITAMNPGDGEVGRGESLGSAMTDADGGYRILVPRAGTWFYFMAVPRGYVYPKDQGRRALALLPGESQKTGFDFTLRADPKAGQPIGSATVKGRVLDLDGNPLEGVVIKDDNEYMSGGERLQTAGNVAKTDADGRFTFKVFTRGRHRALVGGDGYSVSRSEWLTPKEDEVVELPDMHVVLYTNTLSGTLTDSAGTLLSGVPLSLTSKDDSGWRQTVSDSDGEFIFEHVPDGPLHIHHSEPLHNPLYRSYSQEVEAGFHYTIVLSYIDDPDEKP